MLVYFLFLLFTLSLGNFTSTVNYNPTTNTYTLSDGIDENGVSWGAYDNTLINTTGWGQLNIISSSKFSDEIQYTAAGYLEGATTHNEIYALHEMFNSLYSNTSSLNIQITQWFDDHINWLESMVSQYKSSSSSFSSSSTFWYVASIILAQLRGLVDGYNKYAPAGQGLSYTQLFMLNSGGDLMDVMMSIDPQTRTELFLDHCSALILPVFEKSKIVDVFTGHTTWNQYNSMLRIYKRYTFNHSIPQDSHFNPFSSSSSINDSPQAYNQIFSSYPSFLFSGDDYYLTSNGLAVIETTFTIFNSDLYQYVKPENGVLTWMRSTIANKIATNGSEWASLFSTYNSGTYNNQWMVVDYKLIGEAVDDNLFWVVEQIPGTMKSADMTQTLNTQGYWPSYNIPYFENIYNLSGYASMAQQNGEQYVYNASARANIFRRDAPKIKTVEDMKYLMQYNDWENDPLSLGDPSLSISSRFDLLSGNNSQLTGGIDSKITSAELFAKGLTWAISGPTHQQQPVFTWKAWEDAPHNGQPLEFNFDWLLF